MAGKGNIYEKPDRVSKKEKKSLNSGVCNRELMKSEQVTYMQKLRLFRGSLIQASGPVATPLPLLF
jgi:hypothetical protein